MNVLVSRGGHLTKTVGDTISLGQSTGLIKLSSQKGTIINWERQTNESTWAIITNATNQYEEIPDANATYNYRVAVQMETCPQAYSDTLSIVVSSVGLDDINLSSVDFNLYPNPSKGVFEITSSHKDKASIVITNSLGQVVYRQDNVAIDKATIDLSNSESGAYLVSIKLSNNLTATKQIIINKK
jgi:hypothetical protein